MISTRRNCVVAPWLSSVISIVLLSSEVVYGGECPYASETQSEQVFIDCYDISTDGKVTINKQEKSTQRNFKFHFLNMSSVQFTLSIYPSSYKYANTIALFSFEKVPRKWDITTAGIQLGNFGKYDHAVDSTSSFSMKVTQTGPNNGSITIQNISNSYSNDTSVPKSPGASSDTLQLIPSYSRSRISTEYYEYINTTTSGKITTSTIVSGNRNFINTTLYISIYCLSDCTYELLLKSKNSYLSNTCPNGMGLSKSNNSLCCPYNGCNGNGNCVMDHGNTKLPICICDKGYTGKGCATATETSAIYGFYIGGLLVIAFFVVCGSFTVMRSFMNSLAPSGKKMR